MKKFTLILAILSLVFVSVNAQEKPYSLGVRGGINLSNLSNDGPDMDARIGYQFGVVGEYKLPNNLFLQGSLNISSKGAKLKLEGVLDYDGDGINDKGNIKSTWNAAYLELPILIGYKVNVADNFGIKFMAGPYIAYGVGGNISAKADLQLGLPNGEYEQYQGTDKVSTFSDSSLKRFDFGLSGGVAAEYNKLTFTLGYDFGLTNISRGSNKIHNRSAFLTVGYTIF